MINLKKVKGFCREDISKIQNYEQAVNDETQVWHCHHRLGIAISIKKLKELGCYYKRPACEFIFLTKKEHMKSHMIGNTRGFKKGQESLMKGKHHTEEAKRKNSEAHKGEKNPLYGKHHTEETKKKMSEAQKGEKSSLSKPIVQIDKQTGQVIKTWPCTMEVERVLGIAHQNISNCCLGKKKSAGGYIWKYAD